MSTFDREASVPVDLLDPQAGDLVADSARLGQLSGARPLRSPTTAGTARGNATGKLFPSPILHNALIELMTIRARHG
ncbi:MAG TPA: hypothetical protein VNF07_02580 [Acidimicrobiales bacterium]|nr:hypothetical protein [Acidimicrobiales bacterium]